MPRHLPAREPGFAAPAAASIALHAVVLGAVAGLIGWFGGGGEAQRAVQIGVGPPQLRAPAFEPEALPDGMACGDELEPRVMPVAEEFPVSLYEAIVAADAPPAWLQVPPRERREKKKNEMDELAAAGAAGSGTVEEANREDTQPLSAPEAREARVARTAPSLQTASCAPPEYPRLARRRNLEGTVWLRLNVSAEGLPDAIILEISSGHALLDEAALVAARGWRLAPATRDGLPVEGVLRVPVTFRLQDAAPTRPE